MEVRRLGPEDWQLLRDTRLRALREEPQAFCSTLEREAAFDRATWAERTATSFVAEDGGRVVGLVGGVRGDDDVELVGMWVAPEARGTGVADALVAAVVAWADGPVRLEVLAGNERAERCYARHGFVRTAAGTGSFHMVRP